MYSVLYLVKTLLPRRKEWNMNGRKTERNKRRKRGIRKVGMVGDELCYVCVVRG